MIVKDLYTVNGKEFERHYSDDNRMIERDGCLYDVALDRKGADRVYTETDLEIPREEEE